MEDQSKTLAVSVRAKEFVSYHCSCCGHCCRHIENCVMVESLDAYRMAKHLRNQHCGISSTDDVLLRYCEPMPLTDEGYPIYVLKTVGADATCIFLRENQCSIYAARPRTCRLYPFSVGPGERGRDFEYCLCFDDKQQKGIGQRLAVPQLSQRGQGIFEATVSGHPRDWPADAPYAGRNAPSSCIQDIVLSLLSF